MSPDGAPEPFSLHPLSEQQKGIYFESLRETGASRYNIAGAFRMAGELDIPLLDRAMGVLVRRHSSLRTAVRTVDGTPWQAVFREVDCRVEARDLSALPAPQRDAALAAALRDHALRPFPLEQPPLFRMACFTTGPDARVLSVCLHHILSDGATLELLRVQLAEAYACLRAGGTPSLEAPQFTEYVDRENERLAGGRYDGEREYWRVKMAGASPLCLPGDLPADGPGRDDCPGRETRFRLDAGLVRAIRALARGERATVFMLLLAGFKALLHLYTLDEDLTVSCPFSTRIDPDTERMFGYFINTLPLRDAVTGGMSFRDLLRDVKASVIGAYRNLRYPNNRIFRDIGFRADALSRSFTDVAFGFEAAPAPAAAAGGTDLLAGAPVEMPALGVPAKLLLLISETAGSLEGSLQFRPDIYSQDMIARLIRHYTRLMEVVTAEGGAALAVNRIEVISPEERTRILTRFNRPKASYPRTLIHRLFEARATEFPGRTALRMGSASLTYAELDAQASRLRDSLASRGVRRGSIVGILLHRSPGLIAAMLGVLKAGGAYLPLDPDHPRRRKEYMLGDSGASCLVTARGLDPGPGWEGPRVFLDEAQEERRASAAAEDAVQPDDPAYVIYTSGTTGNPKGVVVTHRNVVRLITNAENPFDFNERDVWTLFHSPCFDFSVWEMYGALLYGGCLLIIPRETSRDPRGFLSAVRDGGVTILNQTPSAFSSFMAAEAESGGAGLRLRCVIFGGEALRPALLRDFHERHPSVRLVNMFGITETTVHVTIKDIRAEDIRAGLSNIGIPIPTLRVYICNPEMKLVPIGVPGEMLVGGDGVAQGYLNRPDLTAERFLPDPFTPGERVYRSGDVGRWLPTGEIEYLGRMDHQVKIRGFRVELAEIEARILGREGIRECTVTCREDGRGGKILAAYYVGDRSVPAAEWRRLLGRDLPDYMLPARFMRLPSLPMTPNGKVDRAALPEIAEEEEVEAPHPQPRTDAERDVMEALEKTLNLAHVGMDDDFFALGGDSIKAIQAVALLEKAGYPVRIGDVFQHRRVRDLAAYLDEVRERERRIGSAEEAAEALRSELGVSARWAAYDAPCGRLIVLFLEGEEPPGLMEWMHQRCRNELVPHHVRDGRKTPFREGGALSDRELADLLGLEGGGVRILVRDIRRRSGQLQARMARSLKAAPTVRSYPMSPVQRGFVRFPVRLAGYFIPLPFPVDIPRMTRAVKLFVQSQGLMKSLLARSGGGTWREKDWETEEPLLFIDASSWEPVLQREVIDGILSFNFRENFRTYGRPGFRIYLIRKNRKEHLLVFSGSHVIFDGFSYDIIHRHIMELYRRPEAAAFPRVSGYERYVRLVRGGPRGLSAADIIRDFELQRHHELVRSLLPMVRSRARRRTVYLDVVHPVSESLRGTDSSTLWGIALYIFSLFCRKAFGLETVPASLIYHGRKYGEEAFFDDIGNFIDFIPVVLAAKGEDPQPMIDAIRGKLDIATRANVNFAFLQLEPGARREWGDVQALLRAGGMRVPQLFVFNFLEQFEEDQLSLIRHASESRFVTGRGLSLRTTELGLLFDVIFTRTTLRFALVSSFGPGPDELRRLLEETIRDVVEY